MLHNIIKGIEPKYLTSIEEARIRVDSLAKPLGSLGRLEDIVVKLAGITGKVYNKIENKCVIIMSSDNGVVEEGVASAPQYVTLAQTKNFIKGKTGVAALSKTNNTKLMVVDIGINSDEKINGVINRKISKGTKNIFKEDAMTYRQAEEGITIGIEMVKKAKEEGYHIIGVGEMGIGNTTTSAAVLSALINCEIEEVVGKGGGVTEEAFNKKKHVVRTAIESKDIDRNDPIDIIAKVGGYDIAGMTGVFLGAAYYRMPVVIDGFISVVAALCATRLNENVKDFCIPSHKSEEIGYNLAMKELGLSPILNLGMRLGEGSGCPIAFSVIEFAISMMENMATFEEGEIDDSYLEEVRGEENYIVK
ncbi:nicotinate-nucleotide--dimethylbenzimidazole phosphoribosyltransferase [Clostridium paraputrificum]|uniref:nicotinate-nucleotide--dimethylbenzimidazole phosphoribosyltransferase n=1 Tax=Clostridium paraputrificum TaxID=29363 RepID=UPI003D34614B